MKPCNRTLFVLTLLFAFTANSLHAQKTVDVNLLTGTANVTIPITTLQKGDITVPLYFYYSATGLRVEDYDQRVGMGWRINTDYAVSRILKGFPDDVQYAGGTGFSTIKGWIRDNTIGTKVENFTIAGGINPSTCANEVSDYSYMNSNFSDNLDTEPDIFVVSAPGLSCQFAFDKSQNIQVIPFQDLKITKTLDGTTGEITSFTVVNDKGVTYLFDKKAACTKSVDVGITPSTLPAFRRNYSFFRRDNSHFDLQYTGKWYLSTMTDTKGVQFIFGYNVVSPGPAPRANESVDIIKYNSGTSQYESQHLYTNSSTQVAQQLYGISYTVDNDIVTLGVSLTWDGSYSESKLTSIKVYLEGLEVTPAYTIKFNQSNDQGQWGRYFLKTLSFGRGIGDPLAQYKFSYEDVNESAGTSYLTGPASITNGQDYWGYYDGRYSDASLQPEIWVYASNSGVSKYKITRIPSYGGSDEVQLSSSSVRTANTNAMKGILTQIIHPNGGYTWLEYENNKYYDPDISGEVTGGGVRVKKIIENDGLNTINTTFYDYVDGSSVTTGRIISEPTFCFAFPNTTTYSTLADRVKNSTYRSFYNLSDEGTDVLYGKVTVRKTNGGKSVYEYKTSGTWKSSAVGAWYETNVYMTRNYTSTPSPCNSIAPSFIENGKYNYPFPANPNYDYDRGLPTKVTNYNESGDEVSEVAYSYTLSHLSPTKIAALKFDDLTGGGRGYAKYDVVSKITNMFSQKVTKTYTTKSPYDATAYTTETESYGHFINGDHILPISIQKTNSDGTVFTTKMKYVKDYNGTSGSSDPVVQAIDNLKTQNRNELIETYQTVTPSGGTEKLVNADLVTYKAFNNTAWSSNMYLPYETYHFHSPTGVTGFSASTISSGSFTKYSSYYKTGTMSDYGLSGTLKGTTNNLSRINSTTIVEPALGLPVAAFNNAKPTEVIVSTFDINGVGYAMSGSNYTPTSPGRASSACVSMTSSSSLVKSNVDMATTNSNMIFSCWIKDAAASGTLTVNLSASGLNANYTISYTSNSAWTYYEVKIPKPSQTPVTVTITTNQSLKIDDVLMYPGNGTVKTYSYNGISYGSTGNMNNVLTAETGMGGSTKYYDYDDLGRSLTTRDVDNNIRQATFYRQAHNWPTIAQPSMSWPTPVVRNTATTFTASSSSSIPVGAGVIYIWVWGDGNTETSTTNTKAHTYTTAGNYTATVTIAIPGVGSSTSNNNTVTVNP